MYRLVIVGEIAVALMVMIVATFALDIWRRDSHPIFAYDAEHVLSASVQPRQSCDSLNGRQQFWLDMSHRVAAVGGVRYAVAFATEFPMANQITSDQPGSPIQIVLGRGMSLGYTAATPDYFRVYGFPIVAGRDFEPGDVAGPGSRDREPCAGREVVAVHVAGGAVAQARAGGVERAVGEGGGRGRAGGHRRRLDVGRHAVSDGGPPPRLSVGNR